MFANKLELPFVFYHKPDTEISFHCHDYYELVYYLSGSGTTIIDDVQHEYAANTFSLIRPRTYHNETHYETTELFCFGFSLNDSNTIKLENGLYSDQSSLLMQIANKMRHEILTKRIHHQIKLELLLNEFLIEYERMRSARSFVDSFEYIEKFLNENFNQEIQLPSLAKITGYSYDHFRHIFKAKTGESPMNYIINRRIEHAKKLMLSTDMTMSSISQDCGFSNSSQFAGTFRKMTGLTPTEFKKKHYIQWDASRK